MPPKSAGPRSKEELLNKMLSYDFSGDIRELGEGARIERVSPNTMRLTFPEIDRVYEISVHIPREEKKAGRKAKPEVDMVWESSPEATPRRRQ